MFKQSSSRNQRSKGFKIKHALQIALLLAVCIWLIYQVKHSHDKKKAFEESASKLSEKIESQHEIIKFGRKDLNPRVERTASENERHGEEEETQEEEEEEIKHEEEEQQQEEENKPEESENEGRGDGDDEIDEHEQQQIEEEAKREEDFVDEEERDKHDSENEENEMEETQSNENEERETEEEIKESEEKVNEEETKESEEKVNEEETKESAEKENEEESKENEEETKKIEEKENEEETKKIEEKENEEETKKREEQDHDRNTQEAREEQYKGDDASSAVFRDTQTVSTEAESGVIGNSNEKEHVESLQVNESGMGNKTNNLDEVTSEQKDSDLKAGDGETTESNSTVSATYSNSTSTVNATEIQEKGTEENVSKLEDESLPILTTKESIDLQEVNNSSTSQNVGTLSASLQNGTDITEDQKVETTSSDGGGDLDHKPVFLDQTENSNMTAGMSRLDSNSSLSTTTQNEDASKKESEESSSNSGNVVLEEQNAREEDSSESSTTNENVDGDQNEKSETTTEEGDNSSSSSTNDNEDLIDSNSTEDSLFPEVKETQTDLGTLPEIETEGNNSEDVAAER